MCYYKYQISRKVLVPKQDFQKSVSTKTRFLEKGQNQNICIQLGYLFFCFLILLQYICPENCSGKHPHLVGHNKQIVQIASSTSKGINSSVSHLKSENASWTENVILLLPFKTDCVSFLFLSCNHIFSMFLSCNHICGKYLDQFTKLVELVFNSHKDCMKL